MIDGFNKSMRIRKVNITKSKMRRFLDDHMDTADNIILSDKESENEENSDMEQQKEQE